MVQFSGPPRGAIRNKPISAQLKEVLEHAAHVAGIDAVIINSGGQDTLGEGTRRTGSTRHDRGRAADVQCKVGHRTLTFTNQSADPVVLAFVKAAAAAGATGIGAATDYMGDRTIHVGFGTSVHDTSKLTWGRNGGSAHAPQWLRQAAGAGWADPATVLSHTVQVIITPGKYVVIARSGLRLRAGPGTDFEVERLLPLGTALTVVAIDPIHAEWARVDLEGDGLLDGYVHSGFIGPADEAGHAEFAPEPDDGDNG
jgi:Bacterial SH3 domain